MNAMLLAKVCLIDAVHFGDLNALLFESSGSFLVVRRECLAVTTPV